jgi:hypothetical protein
VKPWNMVTEREKAWLAGVFSVKGCLQPGCLSLKHTANPDVLHGIAELLGGGVRFCKAIGARRVVNQEGPNQGEARIWKDVNIAIWEVKGKASLLLEPV